LASIACYVLGIPYVNIQSFSSSTYMVA